MRFMMLVKHTEKQVQGDKPVPPPQKLVDEITKLSEEAVKSGAMIANGGLAPTAVSSRIRLSGGKVTVTDGPFAEGKEIVGGFAILDYRSKEEAVEGARQFMELHRQYWPGWEGETEVRQIFGPEDFAPCK
ncbi:MAG: hypothetical protein DMG36_14005 [Acidobacteria bacterium]|nr:MAG: hypothetical protein DMG36_14005 [Acidobacteriota bacterium]